MKKIIYFLIACMLILFATPLHAKVWESINPGYWTDSTVWGTSNAPTYNTNDTFIIKHYIIYQQNLTFNGPSRIKIEATGTLCGLKNLGINIPL